MHSCSMVQLLAWTRACTAVAAGRRPLIPATPNAVGRSEWSECSATCSGQSQRPVESWVRASAEFPWQKDVLDAASCWLAFPILVMTDLKLVDTHTTNVI